MKKGIIVIVVLVAFITTYGQQANKIWETEKNLDIPESVLYDDSVIYVSNLNGKPTEKNGLGYISKLSPDGEILKLKWIEGFNAPKGMAVYDDKLYVTDIDRIAVINRKEGKLISFIPVNSAQFLNDATVSESGIVAFSDMYDNTIYKLENNEISILSKSEDLAYVNGLWWGADALYAGANGTVFTVNTETGDLEQYISNTGGIDGLEKIDNKRFVNSDWSGKVQVISPSEAPVILFNTTNQKINAADIEYNTVQKILYVPTFYGKSVVAYELSF